eukprot:Phypoly_transcript_16632.p1 GENE.Phypoly_transcript_16632~~Phypoly_transcript_16632.p1  ORF type:complete len:279 (+),score=35.75 Phypoly_transcript_16632:64-837(+)
MESLKDKVVVVTGSGSGIGRQTSIDLAKHGAKVIVADINLEGAEETVKLILSQYHNAQAVAVKTDISSSASVVELIEKTVEKFGRLDLAVNNAGVAGEVTPLAEYSEELFDQVVNVDLKGVFLCLKYQIKQMQKQGKGSYSIVNTSSTAGIRGFPFGAPYSAAKHGVIGLTKTAALEYSKSGIRINAVLPGPVNTPLFDSYWKQNPDGKEDILKSVPLGRAAKPEEISSAILWLLSSGSSYTTGSEIVVDGGGAASI